MSIDLNFSTPIYRAIAGPEALSKSLLQYILEQEKPKHRNSNSPQNLHQAVFESKFDFFQHDDARTHAFKDFCFNRLMGFLCQISQLNQQQLGALHIHSHCWFHITRDFGFVRTHTHPLASWSMVYCVHPGDQVLINNDHAGHLILNDPRGNASMFLDPTNRQMLRQCSFNAMRIRLKAGELLFFPSYLQHSVEPYQGELPRITIAANFWFKGVNQNA